nr:3-methylitaconate isomerase [Quercus suber]
MSTKVAQKAKWASSSGNTKLFSQSIRVFVNASQHSSLSGNMRHSSFRATFARGGTSNGLVILRSQLPTDREKWQPILAAAMGSPDEYGRQLNGMGSGISSTSKVCVIEASDRPGVDIDFTFVQVGVREGELDLAGNCGNMSSIVGPVALSEGLVSRADTTSTINDRLRTVKIFNTNTSKTIDATFAIDDRGAFEHSGNYAIDGVPGQGSRITLSFLNPEGAKTGKALPTGNVVDVLDIPQADGGPIEASLVDIANPGVFVRASELGIDGSMAPDAIQADLKLMSRLETIRRKGAELMGMDPAIQTVPKILILSTPNANAGYDIQCRALSMQQAHKAIPGTLALNLGSACSLAGTIPHQLVASGVDRTSVTIGHPGGKIEVGCDVKDGQIQSALLHRTARILMKGEVFYSLA